MKDLTEVYRQRSIKATEMWSKRRRDRNDKWIVDVNGIVHIPMTRGVEALIDVDDIEKVRPFNWTARISHKLREGFTPSYYAEAHIPGDCKKTVFLHNLLMNPEDGLQVDHIDRNGLNCVRSNMRFGTQQQNSYNKNPPRKVRPYRGVYKSVYDGVEAKTWTAKVMVSGKYIYSYGHQTESEAAEAYNELAKKYHGEFAVLNEIMPTKQHFRDIADFEE